MEIFEWIYSHLGYFLVGWFAVYQWIKMKERCAKLEGSLIRLWDRVQELEKRIEG